MWWETGREKVNEGSESGRRVGAGETEEAVSGDCPDQKSGRIAACGAVHEAETGAEKDNERNGEDEGVHAGIVGDLLRFRIEVLGDLVLDLRLDVLGAPWSPSESLFMW